MDRYEVLLYPKALRDIDDICSYIVAEKLAPGNAKKQTDRICKAIKELATFQEAHQDRLEGRFIDKGYKQLVIDNYFAIYKIDKDKKKVYVVTVVYQKRDI